MQSLDEIKDYKIYGASDVLEDLLRFNREGHPGARKLNIPEIDPHFSLRKGFILFTGYPGNGKSHVLDWMVLLACKKHGLKASVYSPESYPVWEYVDHLVRIWTGRSTDPRHKSKLTESEIISAVKDIMSIFRIFDFTSLPNVDTLLDAFQTTKSDIYICDPFNFLDDNGVNLTQHIKQSASKFKNFSTHTDSTFFLVEHPKEPDRQRDTDDNGNLRAPGLFNLYGGSMWRNKVDIAVTIHIDNYPNHTYGQDKVFFKVLKVKNQAVYGKPGEIEMNFNYMTQRYEIRGRDYFNISPF